MKDRLDRVRMKTGVAALGAATVDRAGGIEVAVTGSTSRDTPEPVQEDDSWHIGSCGKSLTAALYARLVEQGQAEWGLPLPALFPDLAGIHPGWSSATVDDLFTCRSGLPGNLDRAAMVAAYRDPRLPTEQRSTAALSALANAPGKVGRFLYSNLGYVIAGAAMDRLGGRSFESLLESELLQPLGATSGGFGVPPRICGHRPRLQLGSLCLGQGRSASPDDIHSDNPPLYTPAGRLHLTLGDWARVQRLFLEGTGFLAPGSVQRLLRMPGDGRGMAMGWAPVQGVVGVGLGMQGSNTLWAASAMMSDDRSRVAMVIANDGRSRTLSMTAHLAVELLAGNGPV
jgi:D-alanyl-D-alanine carboxypeptidase